MTDSERFEALFHAHRRQVLAYARRRVDAATADDVVADAFLVCWRRLDDVPSDALPWLLGVARRCLANRVRGDARRLALAERAAGAEVAASGDPAEVFGERERVLAAFAALSERDREVLALVAWEGLDVAGAATAMGCSKTALKVRLHRARRRLAARLDAPRPSSSLTSPEPL